MKQQWQGPMANVPEDRFPRRRDVAVREAVDGRMSGMNKPERLSPGHVPCNSDRHTPGRRRLMGLGRHLMHQPEAVPSALTSGSLHFSNTPRLTTSSRHMAVNRPPLLSSCQAAGQTFPAFPPQPPASLIGSKRPDTTRVRVRNSCYV